MQNEFHDFVDTKYSHNNNKNNRGQSDPYVSFLLRQATQKQRKIKYYEKKDIHGFTCATALVQGSFRNISWA